MLQLALCAATLPPPERLILPSRTRWFATLAILAMTVLALGSAEVIARFAFPGFADDSHYQELLLARLLNSGLVVESPGDPSRFLAYSPNAVRTFSGPEYRYTVRTNSLGFRSKEIQPAVPGEYRVLLLGDSMFVGIGSEEEQTIAVRLEERSRAAGGPGGKNLSAFNFAVGGFNTAQELSVLRHFGAEIRPSLVVLGFFVGNDFLPNALARFDEQGNYAVDDGKLKDLREGVRTGHAGLYLPSAVWRILALNLLVPRLRYRMASTPEVMHRSLELLGEVNNDCRALGVPLLIVMIYPREGVEGGWVASWSGSREVAQELIRLGRGEGLQILDLLSVMRGATDARDCYYKSDGHLTPAGNARVADAIYRVISQGAGPGESRRASP